MRGSQVFLTGFIFQLTHSASSLLAGYRARLVSKLESHKYQLWLYVPVQFKKLSTGRSGEFIFGYAELNELQIQEGIHRLAQVLSR